MIQPLHILHPPFWLILGGSLCEDLGFFHSFKTSPRSSKSESGCKSYACFNFGVPAVFLWAGCPGLGRMSGLPDVRDPPGNPANYVQNLCLYVGFARRMSGPCPDVRAPGTPRMSGILPDVRPSTSRNYTEMLVESAGCLALGRMSGPSWIAGCPGLWPDVRVPCFYSTLCTRAVYISNAGCPARHSHLHSNGHICTTTIYSLSPPRDKVDHSPKRTLEHLVAPSHFSYTKS